MKFMAVNTIIRLNPFRAGRCLSTDEGEVVTFAQLMS